MTNDEARKAERAPASRPAPDGRHAAPAAPPALGTARPDERWGATRGCCARVAVHGADLFVIRHSGFVILSSFGFRHSSFTILYPFCWFFDLVPGDQHGADYRDKKDESNHLDAHDVVDE